MENSFYVDDLLGGADSEEEALDLYRNLRQILGKGGFNLRKWRSSSAKVLANIPDELLEALPTQDLVDKHSARYPKALGVAWDSRSDTMATHIELPVGYSSTKRGVVSDIARTFDVLGWLSPAILPMKLLYRELWKQKIGWDEEEPDEIKAEHKKWREELPLLAEIQLPRCYYSKRHHLTVELHGFSDASQEAYSAVVYLRATYRNSPPTCRLVVAKTRVAPLKQLTNPRLELCGATLLSKLLDSTRQTLDMPLDATHAWCDSTIVLAWLDGSPRRYQTYVGNRISTVTSLILPTAWKHVPTKVNPTDCASRGMGAEELKTHSIWWHGPSWLHHQPVLIPKQPHKSELRELQDIEAKPSVCHVVQAALAIWLESRYSSYRTLLHVTAWVIRFANNFLAPIKLKPFICREHLTVPDIVAAETFLCKASQRRTFPAELHCLKAHPPQHIPSTSHLLVLHPVMSQDGLLHVGGCLARASIPLEQRCPIILSAKDIFTKLLFQFYHRQLHHCGPTLLLSHAGGKHHVVGARKLSRTVCKQCMPCRKAATRVEEQLMGQLPPDRVNPSPPFSTTGIDAAGPFTLKKGHTRRPVLVKAYLILFVCFSTKAVHIEVVSDLTTEAFLAALKRFTSRRGVPAHIHTDNGSNFVGAKNDLQQFYHLLSSGETKNAVQAYFLTYELQWHNIPERAPHFSGLWEAAVKAAKFHLKRVVGEQKLTYEEMATVSTQVEACLNSRPLRVVTSHSPDGVAPLTPGHFLICRPLKAYPESSIHVDPSLLKRWNLCQALTQQFWRRWSQEYLQELQKSTKGHRKTPT